MTEKKNEIFISKSREGYSLEYEEEDACRAPKIIINSMGFYKIIEGLLGMSKNIYEKGVKKISFNEYDLNEIPKKEKKIFKDLINMLEKISSGDKNLEGKINEIRNILIHKENTEKYLIREKSRIKEESFNSLYKIAKEYKTL